MTLDDIGFSLLTATRLAAAPLSKSLMRRCLTSGLVCENGSTAAEQTFSYVDDSRRRWLNGLTQTAILASYSPVVDSPSFKSGLQRPIWS